MRRSRRRERADKALYRAKALGRNRVESAVDELAPLAPGAPVEADVTTAAVEPDLALINRGCQIRSQLPIVSELVVTARSAG
jgi:hypothetical protein